MTKKDFELIAAVFANLLREPIHPDCDDPEAEQGAIDGIRTAAVNLADALATTNPRFDRARFLQACGVAS
ncbi:MAG: hypothetical protein LLG14_27535 [Nocardiaceae bacterium]|nr:hypothetical protein [Nocardiaceae bacterium]